MEPGRNGGKPSDARSQDTPELPSVGDLYRAYYPALLRRMRRHLPEMAAEDAVQRAFLLAFQDIRRYDSQRAAAQTWLFRLADQALAMHLRSRARRLRAEREGFVQEERPPGLDPAEREEVRRLLERLGPISHQIMAAKYILGLSTEEIATELGLSPVAVRQRVFRCLTRLRMEAEAESDSGHANEFSPGCHRTAASGRY